MKYIYCFLNCVLLLACAVELSSKAILLPYSNADAVLKLIKKYLSKKPVIIEAGAYNGEDSKRMSKLWPQGTIHCFEPVPELYKKLLDATKSCSNIKTYGFALSDKNGVAEFYNSALANNPNQSYASGSLLEPKEHLHYAPYVIFNNKIKVPTVTLVNWAKKNKIKKIDMLWLDMQGYELNVLKSAKELLENVKVIYTELELVEAYKGQYLYKDVKQWLEQQGFKMIAKDFTKKSNNWFGNGVFVKKRLIL